MWLMMNFFACLTIFHLFVVVCYGEGCLPEFGFDTEYSLPHCQGNISAFTSTCNTVCACQNCPPDCITAHGPGSSLVECRTDYPDYINDPNFFVTITYDQERGCGEKGLINRVDGVRIGFCYSPFEGKSTLVKCIDQQTAHVSEYTSSDCTGQR